MNTQEIMPGTLVHGRYIVRVRIGEGGGGIVYRAYDTNLESWVILKQIKESAVRPDDRRTEVNVLKELRHQRIPKVLDYFVYEGRVYTVMDFISGRDFGMMLREYHRFDERRVLKWAGQLADVLAYIHSRKPPIVHSDVKPSNIMVDQNDEVTLIDFNIARIFQKESITTTLLERLVNLHQLYPVKVEVFFAVRKMANTMQRPDPKDTDGWSPK